MTDILDTVKAALAKHDARECECYRRSMSMCVVGSEPEADVWLRALVDRCEQAEADLAAMRERYAEAVEAAFRAGFAAGADAKGMAVSWHWAEAKVRLT